MRPAPSSGPEELIHGLRELPLWWSSAAPAISPMTSSPAVAHMEADNVLRLANCDLKSMRLPVQPAPAPSGTALG